MVLKICSGFGRDVGVDAAISVGSYPCLETRTPQFIETQVLAGCFPREQSRCLIARNPFMLAYFPSLAQAKRRGMKREYYRWYSHRLGMERGVVVYGHCGTLFLGFPTHAGAECDLERQGSVSA